MGRSADPSNRFFQLFRYDLGHWKLSTPLGIATNGGLVVNNGDESLLAVRPYYLFRNTAITDMKANAGTVISMAIANGPNTLATTANLRVAISSAGDLWAESPKTGSRRWHRLLSWKQLAKQGQRAACVEERPSALLLKSGKAVLMSGCANRSGILLSIIDPLHASVIQTSFLEGGCRHAWVQRAQVAEQAQSLWRSLLVSCRDGALESFWPGLHKPKVVTTRAGHVQSTSISVIGTQLQWVVVSESRHTQLLSSINEGANSWSSSVKLPRGTKVVASAGQHSWAFVPQGGALAIWSSSVPPRNWKLSQHFAFKLPYGSNS